MSLITLTSKDIYADPAGSDHYGASALRCNFREGIPLNPGDSVSLVNMSLSTSANLNITRGYNDTMVFLIGTAGGDAAGNGRVFDQKVVQITPGSYRALDLGAKIAALLKDATIMGPFKGLATVPGSGWNCTYDGTSSPPTYTIQCIQVQDTDAVAAGGDLNVFRFVRGEDGNDTTGVTLYDYIEPDFDLMVQSPDPQRFHGQEYNNGDYDARAPGYIAAGEQGIFANNGAFEIILKPTMLIDTKSDPTLPPTAGTTITDLDGFRAPDGAGGFLNSTMILTWQPDPAVPATQHVCRWQHPGAAQVANYWQWKLVDESAPVNEGFTSYWYAYYNADGSGNGMWLVRDGSADTATVAGKTDGDKKPVDPATNEIQWRALSGSDGGGRGMPFWNIEVKAGQQGVAPLPHPGGPLNIRMALMEPLAELDGTRDQWENAGGAKRALPEQPTGIEADLVVTGGVEMQIVDLSRNGGYARSNFGFVRQQMYNATNPEGFMTAGPDAIWNADLPGFDVVCCIENPAPGNAAGDPVGAAGFASPHMSINRLKGNRPFPEAGWRGGDYIPWSPPETHADPWNADTVAGSWLKVRIEIQECLQWVVKVNRTAGPPATDFATAGDWVDEKTIWDTRGKTVAPGTTLTKESHYQLRPAMALNRGGFYHRSTFDTGLDCCFDPVEHNDSPAAESSAGVWAEFSPEVHAALQLDPPLLAGEKLKLAQLFKWGEVTPAQIGAGVGQLSAIKVPPNVANCDVLLGMPTFKDVLKGVDAEPTFVSTDDPQEETEKPELLVSLPQFPGLKSWNGASTDCGKVIHVVPGEELHGGKNAGELFYAAPFKIPIDLKIAHSQVMYELTALITNADGTMNDGMRHPTNITLLVESSAESKLARAMAQALDNHDGQASNQQSAQIATIGDDNPRV